MRGLMVTICQNFWSRLGGVGTNHFERVEVLRRLVDGWNSVDKVCKFKPNMINTEA